MANMAVVLVLGARPSEQASLSGPRSIVTVAAAGQRAGAGAGDGHDRHAECRERGEQPHDFFGFAALRKDQQQVFVMDAAQVAVDRFGRMQIVAAGAGRGERGRDLLTDQPGLAHAADDHAAAAAKDLIDGPAEFAVEPLGKFPQGSTFELDDLAA